MDLFCYMDNIWFNDIDVFKRSVDTHRSNMLSSDESLLYKKEQIIDIDEIEELQNGRICSFYKGYQFDSFFYRKDSKYLYVILNGALTGKKPQFRRWSYYSFLDGSVLDIADPMYEKYDGLELGWYYGGNEDNLRSYLACYVKKIADYIQVKYENIIFWGSSGGGAAALECANYVKDSIAVTINPQIMLQEYYYANKFEDITQISLEMDKFHRTDGIYQLKRGKHILLMNLRSKSDMEQMKKICETMKIKVKYGINKFSNLIVWIYDCDLGIYCNAHSLQENYCVCFCINWLIRHFDDEKEICDADSLFRLVNEFWSYRYRLELTWRNETLKYKVHTNCKKTVIWGAGEIGSSFLEKMTDSKEDHCLCVACVLDNNKVLNGRTLHGVKILSPDSVENWHELFIIVAVENGRIEIADFLKGKELQYGINYIFYNDL